uniref:Uncharacterized protein n=1 Tax=Chromera velia CCMP2878 TaxID=1169474 RepID=A0A0G4GPK7_9ALVE|eukprot:Cvel_22821.t1-p1 / transcript=Cvel_22821.t1 / gene=Cvel_22821 / organism=Chromera_velia_CCMP2878 / gene_product=hypothetical protein / transcript_product=hypothetical protein / location=Cvel_scaffold2285:23735-26073(+) / protein_length=510 / sequence_SO=supercontig / SO=protein_coding / is_pseudo=false
MQGGLKTLCLLAGFVIFSLAGSSAPSPPFITEKRERGITQGSPMQPADAPEPPQMSKALEEPPQMSKALEEPPQMSKALEEPPQMSKALGEPPQMSKALEEAAGGLNGQADTKTEESVEVLSGNEDTETESEKEDTDLNDPRPETSFKGGSGFRGGGYSGGGGFSGGSSRTTYSYSSRPSYGHTSYSYHSYGTPSYHYSSHSSGGGGSAAGGIVFLIILLILIFACVFICCSQNESHTTTHVTTMHTPNSMVNTEYVNPIDRAQYDGFGAQSEHWLRDASAMSVTWVMSPQGLSGPWKGTYREAGESHDCFYNLEISPVPDAMGLHVVTGRHGDSDGGGWLRGMANIRTGRMIWVEHYEGTSLQTHVRATFVNHYTVSFEAMAVNGVRINGSISNEAAKNQANAAPAVNVVIQSTPHAGQAAPPFGPSQTPYAQQPYAAQPYAQPPNAQPQPYTAPPNAYAPGPYTQAGVVPATQPLGGHSGEAPPPFAPADQAGHQGYPNGASAPPFGP